LVTTAFAVHPVEGQKVLVMGNASAQGGFSHCRDKYGR